MKLEILIPNYPIIYDLNQHLPPETRRAGTWDFQDPDGSVRHRLQFDKGGVLLPNGTFVAGTDPQYLPTRALPSSDPDLGKFVQSGFAPTFGKLALEYTESEPGFELANGQTFQDFWPMVQSTYWRQNFRAQQMVVTVRPGTYYNKIMQFHWDIVPNLVIQAKDPSRPPRLIKRTLVNYEESYKQKGGELIGLRNHNGSALLENLILHGGLAVYGPGSSSLLALYGTQCNVRVRNCRFEYGNNGPVNYPDSRPAGDDENFFVNTLSFEDSAFINCGNSGAGYAASTHGIYLTHCRHAIIQGCYFSVPSSRSIAYMDSPGGHMAKIGAYYSLIVDNIFDNRYGCYSSCIELPYGGIHQISGNVFLSGEAMQGQPPTHIQAMNEWRSHGIARKKNEFHFTGNTHLHLAGLKARDFYWREKTFPDGDATSKNIQAITFKRNIHNQLMTPLRPENINLPL